MAYASDSTRLPSTGGPVSLAIRAVEREHDPGRRLLLAAAAALPFIPQPARAAEAHPDAALLALKERWTAMDDAFMRTSSAASELVDIGRPAMPEALFFHDQDHDFGLHLFAKQRADGRLWYVMGAPNRLGRNADELRRPQMRVQTVPVEPGDKVHPGATHITKKVAWPERQARADEIVAAWDGWMADIQAAQDASGYTAMRAEADRLCVAASAIEDEMEAITPRTLDGLVALAAYARRVQADADDEEVKGGMLARAILAVAAVGVA
ncbi:hypothetical protein [Methylorubrum salsuginis]|uniref:Uncharacterized protein n=1 Tax=Methylorubrum salsuginis TaxID=414703 RepID=A0A1I4FLD6_9HYPH|nr:hypothetical protein [Methylorubrum salsuginis]SFL18712.1 hypothetical protein SAMN04488125_110104 [Methylorubrum salsuginis]